MTELPQYKCHKVVRASKIVGIVGHPVSNLKLACGLIMKTDEAWLIKHQPQMGGYFVRYEDGYESYSPARAFEEGYSLIDDKDLLYATHEELIFNPMKVTIREFKEQVRELVREEIDKALCLDGP